MNFEKKRLPVESLADLSAKIENADRWVKLQMKNQYVIVIDKKKADAVQEEILHTYSVASSQSEMTGQRQPMVTQGQLEKGAEIVRKELKRLGFWTKKLEQVRVKRIPFSKFYDGFYLDGVIMIPKIKLYPPYKMLRYSDSLVHTLHHEYEHALAELHSGIVRKLRFAEVFGAGYENRSYGFVYDLKHHVSEYASSFACENFSETFSLFIRMKSVLPNWAKFPAIRRKRKFIEHVRRLL